MDFRSIHEWADLAQAVGAPIAVVAICYAAWQLRRTRLVEQGRFMLELEDMSQRHVDVQAKLHRRGEWHAGKGGPSSNEEWTAVEAFMAFFEHCEMLLKNRIISEEGFDALFRYQVENIAMHPQLVAEKLVKEREWWKQFLDLCNRLDITPVDATSSES